jgi:hypothetical protein
VCWKEFCRFCGAGPAGRTCQKSPHPSTCWRRLRDWEEQEIWLEIWLEIWRAFLAELNERQQLKWSEAFLDGSFAPAKKGAAESEKPNCLSPIILSPLNGYVKMSPHGDIHVEPERIAASGGDFILRAGEPGVCQSRLAASDHVRENSIGSTTCTNRCG